VPSVRETCTDPDIETSEAYLLKYPSCLVVSVDPLSGSRRVAVSSVGEKPTAIGSSSSNARNASRNRS
jgi:hypothetical protein